MNMTDLRMLKWRVQGAVLGNRVFRYLYVRVMSICEMFRLLWKFMWLVKHNIHIGMTPEQALPRARNAILQDLEKETQDIKDENYLKQRRLDRVRAEIDSK